MLGKKDFLSIFLIFVTSLMLLRSFLKPIFPETHDGQNHLARLANLNLTVIDRHFPPRLAPNLNYKFGYPIFNFNYYFPHILALFPAKIGFSFEASLKIVLFLSLFFGGVFWYLLLHKKLGKIPALAAGLFYITAPFQLTTILVRGSVGEVVAFAMLPFCLWAINSFIEKPSRLSFSILIFSLLGFLLTHNITVLFATPFLLSFSIILIWQKGQWGKLKNVLLSFILSAGLSMFFWLPALLEKKFINLDKIDLSHQYLDHFPTFSQLFYSPWGYGFSVPGPDDGLSFQLGPFHWLAVILLTLYLIKVKTFKKFKGLKLLPLFFLLAFLASIFLMNKTSLFIWKAVPFLHYVQFPWRLLMFAIIAATFLAAYFTKFFPKIGLVLAIGAMIYALAIAKPQGGFHWDNNFHYAFPFTTTIKDEYMPIWFDKEKNHKLEPNLKIIDISGTSSIKEILWKTGKHVYEINSDRESQILERTAYFPGWQAKVNGQKVDVTYQEKEYPGMISFKIPKGKHMVETVFTENTPARRLGDSIAIISLCLSLLVVIFWRKINVIAKPD